MSEGEGEACVRARARARECTCLWGVCARLTWEHFVQETASAAPESISVTPATPMDTEKIVTSGPDIDKQV